MCSNTRKGAVRVAGSVLGLLLVGVMGCSSYTEAGLERSPGEAPVVGSFQEWQILDVQFGESLAFDQLMNDLASQDVIYLGEEHRNHHHIQGAIKVLQGLLARGRRPVLTIEMFGWDGQEGLDRYVSDQGLTRQQFLDQARWKQNWGGDFSDYEPLVRFAQAHRLPLVAMNPPRSLVRKVAREGLADALRDPEMERWDMQGETIVDDPAYRDLIVQQLRDCHGGMSDAEYGRIYQASMFRDEGMAKAIVARLEQPVDGEGPIVSYTGGGHIQYGLPVPDRVARRTGRPIKQATVYITSLEPAHPEYIEELLKKNIAKYVWLTPIGEHGPPVRCG